MSNVKLIHTLNDGDLVIEDGTICMDGGLESAVYLSLFGGNSDGVHWWGNIGENDPDKRYISETQRILVSLPLTVNNLRRLVKAIESDLAWLDAVKDISVEIVGVNRVNMTIKLTGDRNVEFAVNWGASDDCVADLELTRTDATPPPPSFDLQNSNYTTSFEVDHYDPLNVSNDKLYGGLTFSNTIVRQYSIVNPFSSSMYDGVEFDFSMLADINSIYSIVTSPNGNLYIIGKNASSVMTIYEFTWDGTNLNTCVFTNNVLDLSALFNNDVQAVYGFELVGDKIYISAFSSLGGVPEIFRTSLYECDITNSNPLMAVFNNKSLKLFETGGVDLGYSGAFTIINDVLLFSDKSGLNPPTLYEWVLDLNDVGLSNNTGLTKLIPESTSALYGITSNNGKVYLSTPNLLNSTEGVIEYSS